MTQMRPTIQAAAHSAQSSALVLARGAASYPSFPQLPGELELELELELIQTQMTQKPMLRAEGECDLPQRFAI